ncbi:MAG: hypothetical protein H6860_02170 [Rhodospirillales bacterium]|nr:hypothetical protein [Rhodospirillales bacterium]
MAEAAVLARSSIRMRVYSAIAMQKSSIFRLPPLNFIIASDQRERGDPEHPDSLDCFVGFASSQ